MPFVRKKFGKGREWKPKTKSLPRLMIPPTSPQFYVADDVTDYVTYIEKELGKMENGPKYRPNTAESGMKCNCSICTMNAEYLEEDTQDPPPEPESRMERIPKEIPRFKEGKLFGLDEKVLFALFIEAYERGAMTLQRDFDFGGDSMYEVIVTFTARDLITMADKDEPKQLPASEFEAKCSYCEEELNANDHIAMQLAEPQTAVRMLTFCDRDCLQEWIDEEDEE